MRKTVVFVRAGAGEGHSRQQGPHTPLSDDGVKQMTDVSHELQSMGIPIRQVLSSSLDRGTGSAEAFVAALQNPMSVKTGASSTVIDQLATPINGVYDPNGVEKAFNAIGDIKDGTIIIAHGSLPREMAEAYASSVGIDLEVACHFENGDFVVIASSSRGASVTRFKRKRSKPTPKVEAALAEA